MKKEIYLMGFSFLLLFILNYSYLDKITGDFLDNSKMMHVTRVIDGDTIVAGNETIRMLGINTPEKKEILYEEAKKFTNNSVFNKSVSLEFGKDEKDLYGRTLAYVFLNGENINLKLIEEGFANPYFPKGKDIHYTEFFDAWNKCIESDRNLCEKSESSCSNCIQLKELSVKTQDVLLENTCNIKCDLKNWTIKDEGRKVFIFPNFVLQNLENVRISVNNKTNTKQQLFWKNEDYVWTKTGDTLFLRDEKGKLVLWHNY